jgi:hypothetical protein
MTDELRKMWKEATMYYFEVLYRHSPGWVEKYHEKLQALCWALDAFSVP